MIVTAPVRDRQDVRRTIRWAKLYDYDEALLFYIFYEHLFRMSIAGEGCFGLGEPCHAPHFPTKVSRWSLKTFTEQLVDYTRVVVYFTLTHIFHELLPQFRCGERRFMSWGSFSLCAAFSSTPAPTMGPQDIRGPRCESRYLKLELCALVNYL